MHSGQGLSNVQLQSEAREGCFFSVLFILISPCYSNVDIGASIAKNICKATKGNMGEGWEGLGENTGFPAAG